MELHTKPENTIERKFGARIRNLRLAKKLTQGKLAERACLSVVTVNRLENGMQSPPMTRLPAIAKALGVEVWELFVFDDA